MYLHAYIITLNEDVYVSVYTDTHICEVFLIYPISLQKWDDSKYAFLHLDLSNKSSWKSF